MKRTIFNRAGLQRTNKSKATSVAMPSQDMGFAAGAGGVQQVQPSQHVENMHGATIDGPARSKQGDFASTVSSFVDDPSEQPQSQSKEKKARDLQGGMDLLELDFLLKVVENTQATAENDVAMRTLCFNELIRTRRVSEIDSNALSVYAVDRDGHYGTDIQLAAMKQLTERTAHGAKQ